jgi:response regulator of citrate/malate metabolism
MIKLAIIEDNRALSDNYRDYLTMVGNFDVIWEFDSIEDAISSDVTEPKSCY